MSEKQTCPKFIIQSKTDNQKFTIDQKVIDSSTLLKNICDITEITEPIVVNCYGPYLEIYIKLINHYQTLEDEHDIEFEKELYIASTNNQKKELIKLIQNLCILDSDFFLDSVTDFILGILGNEEKMDWMNIRKYLGFEEDFTKIERKLILKDERLEYFLSINTENFQFPFPDKSLYSLKTDFSTPMNSLIARIVERSNAKTFYLLSLINKTMKNEVDRYPFKLTKFDGEMQNWCFSLYFDKLGRNLRINVNCKNYDIRVFNALNKRKILIAEENNLSMYYKILEASEPFFQDNSLEFIISNKTAIIEFSKSYKSIYYFDVRKCPIPSIEYFFFTINESGIKFEEIYNHLIAKNFSKEIKLIFSNQIFKFFYPRVYLRLIKKANASKFEIIEIRHHRDIFPEFIKFITNFMENDGMIKSTQLIKGIPTDKISVPRIEGYFNYRITDVKKYLHCIVTK